MHIIKRARTEVPRCDECAKLADKVVDIEGRLLCENCVIEALALLRWPEERWAVEELQP